MEYAEEDKDLDQRIRLALRNADAAGRLQMVSAVTGVSGGAQYLRTIMESREPLRIMDRAMLGIHLGRGL